MFLTFNIGYGLVNVWLPIYADGQPGGGSELFGFMLGMIAVGEVISAVLIGNYKLPIAAGTMIALAQLFSGVVLILPMMAFNVWAMGIALFLLGFFSSPLTILAQTLRMQVIPDQLRGRTFALLRTLIQGSTPLGGVIAGTALPLIGMLPMIGLSALLVGGPGLAGLAVPELRAAGQPAAPSPEPSETPV
jgi:MFS family permease